MIKFLIILEMILNKINDMNKEDQIYNENFNEIILN